MPKTKYTTPALYCADSMRVLAEMKSGSVDLAVFDPPYPTISGGSNQDRGGKHERPSGRGHAKLRLGAALRDLSVSNGELTVH